MTIDFEDYDGHYIASMIADELPNPYDFIQIKTAHREYNGRVMFIEKRYNITTNSIKTIVRIDYKIPKY